MFLCTDNTVIYNDDILQSTGDRPQNLSYSLHEAVGGNDWWNRFQPVMEV